MTLFKSLVWKLAWRDSRSQRKKLFIYMSSIILGTSALVSINSLGDNLKFAIQDQSKSLLGADLRLSSRQKISSKIDTLFKEFKPEVSQHIQFVSMAFNPVNGKSRFSSIRAFDGAYPFYGSIETSPATAIEQFRNKNSVIIDKSIADQLQLQIGDSLKLGQAQFEILGFIQKIPGESFASSVFAPRIYMSFDNIKRTKLIRKGSIINYARYYKLQDSGNLDEWLDSNASIFQKEKLRSQSAKEQQNGIEQASKMLYRFLNLFAFISLILGSIGIASSIHVYIKEKRRTIASLKCLGASQSMALSIYMAQSIVLTLLGVIIGALLGVGIQQFLPFVFGDLIPFDIQVFISWTSILYSILVGFIIAILFSIMPLLSIRNISPLSAIRSEAEKKSKSTIIAHYLLAISITLAIFAFAYTQTRDALTAIGFTLFLAFAFTLLWLVAKFIIFVMRRFFPRNFSFLSRQIISNLFRPNNQTITLLITVGLGACLIGTMFFMQESVYNSIVLDEGNNKPNMILFDIQADQKEAIVESLEKHKLPSTDVVPIIPMSIERINSIPLDSILSDTSLSANRRRMLQRTFRSTFKEKLSSNEEIIAGKFVQRQKADTDSIFISIEESIAKTLRVGIGGSIEFNVQGISLKSYVSSIRKVKWVQVRPSFFIIFPDGVLNDAPHTYVATTRVANIEQSTNLQADILRSYPNISIVDLNLIINSVEKIINRIAFIIRFMALFSIITGLTVLAGGIISSKYQRIKENVIFRTLGASKKQLQFIMLGEYSLLGFLAALTGLSLSLSSTWLLTKFVFKSAFQPSLDVLFYMVLCIILIVLCVALFNSRGITSRSPLEILRESYD